MPRFRKANLDELYIRGLWLPRRELVEVHDFTEYNPTKAQLDERRRDNARRVAKARAAKRRREEGGDQQ